MCQIRIALSLLNHKIAKMIRGKFQQVGEKETEIFDVQLVREDTRDQIKQKLFQEISKIGRAHV